MRAETKACGHCQVEKPAEAFYADRRTPSGLRSWCKKCLSEKVGHAEANRRYRQRHPERASGRKLPAHDAVYKALTRGKMVRPELCQKCGRRVPLHAHHEDYSRPLDVDWLCRRCHAAHHAEVRRLCGDEVLP